MLSRSAEGFSAIKNGKCWLPQNRKGSLLYKIYLGKRCGENRSTNLSYRLLNGVTTRCHWSLYWPNGEEKKKEAMGQQNSKLTCICQVGNFPRRNIADTGDHLARVQAGRTSYDIIILCQWIWSHSITLKFSICLFDLEYLKCGMNKKPVWSGWIHVHQLCTTYVVASRMGHLLSVEFPNFTRLSYR